MFYIEFFVVRETIINDSDVRKQWFSGICFRNTRWISYFNLVVK